MPHSLRLVLDIGKTAAKLSAWDDLGNCLAKFSRTNCVVGAGAYTALDVAETEAWLEESLRECAALGPIASIIPVGHGAAAALIRDGSLALPVMDYEFPIPEDVAAAYEAERDSIALSGSPAMQWGLNLGRQLFFLNRRFPDAFDHRTAILPWPQFWAWRLSGVAVTEVSSLGAHTDLWSPASADFSPLARRIGWAAKFPGFAKAGAVVGRLTQEWQARTGLDPGVAIHAGLHDSNAALNAARGRDAFSDGDATILSTGTWFVTMRSAAELAKFDLASFAAQAGCLINVDIAGRPVPTALFMGGREFEALVADCMDAVTNPSLTSELELGAARCIANSVMALPTWQPGTGFFAARTGRWTTPPDGQTQRCAASLIYLALMADHALKLAGSERLVVVDGRFANSALFTGALATLRPELQVAVADAENDIALGALRAADDAYPVAQNLRPIAPLPLDLNSYRAGWQAAANSELPLAGNS